MGMTSPVPGISFGTIAILLNFYEKFLDAISVTNIKKNLTFLIPLFLGCIIGIFAFSRLVTFLIVHHGMITYFSFIGMIIGCLPMIYKRANLEKVKAENVAVFAAAFLFMVFLAFISDDSSVNQTLEQLGGISPSIMVWIFFTCFVSAMAMMIPGISGSIIMLMFGVYTVAIEAVSTFNMPVVLVAGAAIILGSLTGIRLIKIILTRFPQIVYCGVLGLIAGSVLIVYPGFSWDIDGAVAVLLAVAFMFVSGYFSKKK